MAATAVIIFIIFVVGIGIIENSNSFSYFIAKGKIKEKKKFIEISFDSFLILREAIKGNKNKRFVLKEDELPSLIIKKGLPTLDSYFYYYCFDDTEETIILFPTFKEYWKYFHWLKKYLKERDKKNKQETIKNNFAEDTVKDLIKDLENFAEQEKKESADKIEQAKNTFNEVNKK